MIGTASLLYAVFKARIGFAIALSAVAGAAMTGGGALSTGQFLVLAVSVLMASAAAGAFNQYAERDLDATMERTRKRPFATGTFRADWRWPAGLGLLLAAAVVSASLALNPVAGVFVFLGAFVYGIVYTLWLKRRTVLNIVVGGLAGSFAVLAGATAVSPTPAAAPVILAIVLFLWTPPHFWSLAMALRSDYAGAAVPMLPVVVGDARAAKVILAHTVALVLLSLAPAAFGMGWPYLIPAAAGGALFVVRSVALVRTPDVEHALANFHASLCQLALLLIGAIVDGALRA